MELTFGPEESQQLITLLTSMDAILTNIQATVKNMEAILTGITRIAEGFGNEGKQTSIEAHTEMEE